MSEFKISRLRFSWVGPWTSQRFYNKDQIVQFEGKAYVCLVPHTSNSFQQELENIEPRWELMMTGQTWRGVWSPSTLYSLDNIIIFGGIVYKCNTPHVSGVVLDIQYWDIYAESKSWQSEWTSVTTYGVGSIVQYGGSVYECIVSHVSAETDLLGLESDYNSEDSTLTKWKILKEGFSWRGEYATSTDDSSQLRYKLNDIVRYGPSIYRCTVGHSPIVEFEELNDSTKVTDTFIIEYWEEWLPGLAFEGVWSATSVYQPGDIVSYGGYVYANKQINNINIVPSFNSADSTDAWELVIKAFEIEGEWDSGTEYKVGSVVTYGGDVYVAIVDSTSEAPGNREVSVIYSSAGSSNKTIKVSATADIRTGMTVIGEGFARGQYAVKIVDATTVILNEGPDGAISNGAVLIFAGVNALFWELLIPGFNWEGRWQADKLYNQDDVIYWINATYKCIREHTSSLLTQPDNDLSNSYWVVYLQHFRGNYLNNPGDLVIYSESDSIALPIGSQATVLKVIEGLPAWSDLELTPAVFYVATNGIDRPEGGATFDTAWRTIKYACESVKEGSNNPNARVLLRNNKKFIAQETLNWFLYQRSINAQPFNQYGAIDEEVYARDINYIIDAVIFDVASGGNSQIVASTLYYFSLDSTNKFATTVVNGSYGGGVTSGSEEQIDVLIVTLIQLFTNIDYVLTNTIPPINYQNLMNVEEPELQYFNSGLIPDDGVIEFVGALERIILTALTNGSPTGVPSENQRLTTTINIKSGTYDEQLPIVLPANCALNGDELRGAVVRPGTPVNTLCTRTIGFINQFVVGSTVNMHHNTPIQFVSLNPVTDTSTIIGGVIAGQTYYVIGSSITDTTIQISAEPDGPVIPLVTNIGSMYVYGGNALSDMFYVQNGTGIRNMTLFGLLGTLTVENEFQTRRPTGGAYVSLDPGTGPDDTSAWIVRKSCYVQNVTTFGKGCVGLKIDSTLHNGGNRSIVSNDFTQVLSDGIGIWCTGGDALTEAVSVFSYYNYAGYFAEDGGRVRATNGNSSYGTFGVIAEGFDPIEIPATGAVNNRTKQAQASAVSALGSNAEILKIQYTHAGEEYVTKTTNMLKYSNNLLQSVWENDGNITTIRAASTPFVGQEAWRISGNTSLTDSSYFYQSVEVAPQGKIYTNIEGENIAGTGTGATFNVTVFSNFYVVAVNEGGSGYVVGNQIKIPGIVFGGREGNNDIVITVETLSITSILTITHQGEVPAGSALPYTLSIYAKRGTAQYFDMHAIFTGYDTRTSFIRYNFDTTEITTGQLENFGIVPNDENRRVEFLEDDWVRVYFTIWDQTAQNNQLEFRVYPRGVDGLSGFTNFYGSQLQKSPGVTFYLDTENDKLSGFANTDIQGAGQNVRVIADELRANSIFQTRILEDSNLSFGGLGYRTQTNNAQGGTNQSLTLAASEVADAAEYEGMRLVVSSGRGAGQFGIISTYNSTSKVASVLKESFETLEIISADAATNRLTVTPTADFNTVYPGQKIQFTPTFYDVDVTSTSQNSVGVTATTGDLTNTMTVESTARLRVNMAVNFSGVLFGGVISNFTYFIIDVINDTTIQLSTSQGGGVQPLNTELGEMILNYPSNTSFLVANSTADMEVTFPIKFTGTSLGGVVLGNTYFIHDIYSNTEFSISSSKVNFSITNTTAADNSITIDNTAVLIPLNSVIVKGAEIGNLEENKRYYVNSIVDGTRFTVSDTVLTRSATATQAVTNLITVDSTVGFIANTPIVFVGTSFGGIVNNRVYYIQVVNSATTLTISESPGGAALSLTNATGEIIVRTLANTIPQVDAVGAMTGSSTGEKETVSAGSGLMEASFFTEIFGGVAQGTTYYVLEKFINSSNEFTITTVPEGITPTSLVESTGSMQIGEAGWDNINSGTPISNIYDSTTVYTIEPRLIFSEPNFDEQQMESILDQGVAYTSIASSDFLAIAVPELGNQVLITDFEAWQSSIFLPISATLEGNGGWSDSTYGNGTWVIISKNGQSVYSVSDGLSWITTDLPLPDSGFWSSIAYGNGRFVAVASGTNITAYSTNDGASWTVVIDFVGIDEEWNDIAYGKDTFVVIANNSDLIKYSTNGGETWNESSLVSFGDSTVTNWSKIKFGNGRFVAISTEERTSAYSFDGITWYRSNLQMSGDFLEFGQGAFLAIDKDSSVAYVSSDGINWRQKTVTADSYSAVGFAFDSQNKKGQFLTLTTTNNAYRINAGIRAQARAVVDNQRITIVSMLEAGSGYTTNPTVKIIDPNNSVEALLNLRLGFGSLGAPTFVNSGSGYNTASTEITFNGNGFADEFQTGLRLVANNVTRFPRPGDNLQFDDSTNSTYRVANSRILKGSTTPNLEVEIQLSPSISQELSPEHNTTFTIRSRFSQVRLTNHDFLNIGFGNEIQSNYPKLPVNTGLQAQNEVQETNNGRVFYSSTDQDGNFRVGDLFAVEQATGIVTLNASDFGLEGLSELTIGGVALGGSPVIVTEFSTDGTFVANSNNIVPTQKAIRTHLASRLSQGGSNTFTGQLIAGTVRVGGPDEIGSTVIEGAEGFNVSIPVKANFSGPLSGWDGDGMAMAYFMKTLVDPSRQESQ